MKQIVCEMCGSTDIIKQDGVFVCQNCGIKYSLEDAKKMMIDGTVDIQGTVKVDNSESVQKYLANARRAREMEDWDGTEKYYNLVGQNDPDNIEAIFYSVYGKARASLSDDDVYKRKATFNTLKNCISIVAEHYQVECKEENKQAITSMAIDLGKMICSNFVYTEKKDGYGTIIETNKGETISMFGGLLDAFKGTIDNIQKIDNQDYLHDSSILLYSIAKKIGYWGTKPFDNWIDEEEVELKNIRQKNLDNYWNENADEKKSLENEKKSISEVIETKKLDIENLPETKGLKNLEHNVTSLLNERDSLSLFKVKEKKALQSKIDALSHEITIASEARAKAADPIEAEIVKLQERIKEIEAKLTNDNNVLNIDNTVSNIDDIISKFNNFSQVSAYHIYNVAISMQQAAEIDQLLKQGEKIKAINLARELAPMGLKEAKDFIDNHSIGHWI